MNFSRRDFVKMSGIAALTSIGLTSSVFSKSADALEFQTSRTFSQLIDSDFYISGNDVLTTAKLIDVKDFPNISSNGECFSMEFETPLKYPKEDTYQVFHPDLGNFELFMNEGKNGEKRVLLATINRL
jgi:hypothetical protein